MELNQLIDSTTNALLPSLESSWQGLSLQEEERRRLTYGANRLKRKTTNSALVILLRQMKNSLFYILALAALLSFFLGSLTDVYIISSVLAINTLLGFLEEYKSEKTFEKLRKYLTREVMIIRAGATTTEDEEMLVPGDIVSLKEGDLVPADIAILKSDSLMVNESQLTGESNAIYKKTPENHISRENLIFMGSTIEGGEMTGVIFATGNKTELGKIALISGETTKVTSYEKSLHEFSSKLVKIILISLAIVFILKLILGHNFNNLFETSLFIIALAVAVVPEALPVIASVTLSSGALKMAKNHCLVKTLSAVEDLGNVNILCTDKTGTLTENKMIVTRITADDKEMLKKIALSAMPNKLQKKGLNSFDQAILNYQPSTIKEMTLIHELPFDPKARRSRVILREGTNHFLVSIGSVETLLSFSHTPKKKEYLSQIKDDGLNGLRHYGYSIRKVNFRPNLDLVKEEKDMNFLGFFTLQDPLRPHALETVRMAEKLGIEIKILSGDSLEVTRFIAEKAGLLNQDNKVYQGDELDKLSDDELLEISKTHAAFARLNPEQKYRLIRILKKDNIVAYQGDGINDAPSLKLADVSIAVSSATDIAKENADIILLRKDIGVIISGIKNGRAIFSNINKYIRFTMIGNFGNFFALSFLFLLYSQLPLNPIELLLISLLTDLPLIAIATDNVPSYELTKPKHQDINQTMKTTIILGLLTTGFTFVFFYLIKIIDPSSLATSLFLFLCALQLIVIFSVRSENYFFQGARLSIWLFLAIIFTFLFTLLIIYLPATQKLFSFSSLHWLNISLIFLLTYIYFISLDILKVKLYHRAKD